MDPNIILGGITPNLLGTLQASNEAAAQQNGFQRQNALAQLYQTQGAGIMNGEQGALNALAGFDPQAALGIQDSRQVMDSRSLGMDQTRQNMAFSAEEMQMKRDQVRKEASDALIAQQGKIDAATLEAERAKLEKGLAMGSQAQTAEQWDQAMLMVGQEDYVGQFENRHMIMAGAMGLKDALDTFKPDAPPKPNSAEAKLKADLTAGLITQDEYQLGLQRLAPKGMEIISDGKGGVTVREGVGLGGGDKMKPSDPTLMIDTIDGILSDPALDYSTGALSFGQAIPGTPMKRFEGRANQLSGQAFLQAFESLKGAGQITEVEGQKATQAIGRLDTAQAPADYRAALEELKSVLKLAQGRPAGWAAQQEAPSAGGGSQPTDGIIRRKFNPETGMIE